MLCCYYTKILIINTAIQKRAKSQFLQQNENFSVLPFTGENDLLFPAPMLTSDLQPYHSAVFADTVFAHPGLIVSVY